MVVNAPNSKARSQVIPQPRSEESPAPRPCSKTKLSPREKATWAELIKRTFLIDVLVCPKCSGRMKVISTISEAEVIFNILDHLGMPTGPPRPEPIINMQKPFNFS